LLKQLLSFLLIDLSRIAGLFRARYPLQARGFIVLPGNRSGSRIGRAKNGRYRRQEAA
jgi:hypothetical protein